MDPYTVTMLAVAEGLKLVNALVAATPPEILKARIEQQWEAEKFWRGVFEHMEGRLQQLFRGQANGRTDSTN